MTEKVIDFRVIIVRAIVVPGTAEEGAHHVFTTSEGREYKSHWGLNGIRKQMEKEGYIFFHHMEEKYVH